MSIAARLWLSTTVILCTLAVLIAGVLWAALESTEAVDAKWDALRLTEQTELVLSDLKDSETGQRGFLLTGSDRYLTPFNNASKRLPDHIAQLKQMTAATPELRQRADQLEEIVGEKLAELSQTIAVRRDQGLEAALNIVNSGRGSDLMDQARRVVAEMQAMQATEIKQQQADLDQIFSILIWGLIIGGFALAACVVVNNLVLLRSLTSPLQAMRAGISRIVAGNLEERIELQGRDELSTLGKAFNAMMDDLRRERASRQHAEEEVMRGHEALMARSEELEDRTRAIDLLGRMANRLPGCGDEAEFIDVVERFAPQILPGMPGALYTLTNSQTLLRRIGAWNSPANESLEFAPKECWGLRRGQPHVIADVTADIVCGHIEPGTVTGYRCLPLVAQSETVGLLYIEEIPGSRIDSQDLAVFTETIAFSLVNLRLRERLRNQSVRDPLTDLFNRRYLEESLELEFSRARRNQQSLSLIMLDIDHFKRFNDLHGHDAGDVVLKAVAQLIKRTVRQGDVACRYGGEEFILVLPGNGAAEAALLGERVRAAVEALEVTFKSQPLGKVTISLGVADYPRLGETAPEVTDAADRALYAAKGNGRNQLVIAGDVATAHQSLAGE